MTPSSPGPVQPAASEPSTPAPTAPANFRDLGGLPARGSRVRRGRVFRSDDLATADSAFVRELVDLHGVSHVIDLRSAAEVAFTGRGPLAQAPVSYHHIPVADGLAPASGRSEPSTAAELGRHYAGFVSHAAPRWALAFAVIGAAEQGGVVFHCAAGKDRTGVLAALLLHALGAAEPVIAEDYARTDAVLAAVERRIEPLAAAVHRRAGFTRPRSDSPLLRAYPEAMSSFLKTMRERHGTVLAPLHEAGLDPTAPRRLRDRLLE